VSRSDAEDGITPRVPDSELEYDSDLIYRHNGAPLTGIGYEDTSRVRSEVEYVNGRQQGPARDWTPDGRLVVESFYYENELHGWQRNYGDDGRPTLEELYL
jgi:antitoxin component YwqK of YwqJK toxin-antitoxin module